MLIQESIRTWGGFHAEILKKRMQWHDGYIIPSTEAGIGVALSEEVAYDVILIKQTGLYEY